MIGFIITAGILVIAGGFVYAQGPGGSSGMGAVGPGAGGRGGGEAGMGGHMGGGYGMTGGHMMDNNSMMSSPYSRQPDEAYSPNKQNQNMESARPRENLQPERHGFEEPANQEK